MRLPCVFYDQSEPCACSVLRRAGTGLLPDGVMDHLAERYCTKSITSCPIFRRAQRERAPKKPKVPSVPPASYESGYPSAG